MRDFFQTNGIEYQCTCVYTPQQNGVVESKHRHILTVARALRFQSHLPLTFWGDCVLTAVYLINRLPSPLLSTKSSFKLLYNRPPSLDHLRVFGCLCYTTVVHPLHKFDPRAKRCVFVGYPTGHKGYKLYDLDNHKFFVSRDVKFCETTLPFSHISTPSDPTFVLPPFIPDLLDNGQPSDPFSTNTLSLQPQHAQPSSLNAPIADILRPASPMHSPITPDSPINPTQPLSLQPTSSAPSDLPSLSFPAYPTPLDSPLLTPESNPPTQLILPSRQSLRPKQPPTWH